MHLTKEQLQHIDTYRIDHLAYFANIENTINWFNDIKKYCSYVPLKNAFYTTCGLTATIVTYYLTNKNLLSIDTIENTNFEIGYCYPIHFNGCYDHFVVVIPDISNHQIIYSDFGKTQITEIKCNFGTIEELTKILTDLDILKIICSQLEPEITIRKIKILDNPNMNNIPKNYENIAKINQLLKI